MNRPFALVALVTLLSIPFAWAVDAPAGYALTYSIDFPKDVHIEQDIQIPSPNNLPTVFILKVTTAEAYKIISKQENYKSFIIYNNGQQFDLIKEKGIKAFETHSTRNEVRIYLTNPARKFMGKESTVPDAYSGACAIGAKGQRVYLKQGNWACLYETYKGLTTVFSVHADKVQGHTVWADEGTFTIYANRFYPGTGVEEGDLSSIKIPAVYKNLGPHQWIYPSDRVQPRLNAFYETPSIVCLRDINDKTATLELVDDNACN